MKSETCLSDTPISQIMVLDEISLIRADVVVAIFGFAVHSQWFLTVIVDYSRFCLICRFQCEERTPFNLSC